MVRDYSRRQFVAGCGLAGAGALAAGGAAASSGGDGAVQPATRWNETYQSDGNAAINAMVPARDDDGFVLAGGTGDVEGDYDRAAWLVKIDAAGQRVWEQTYTFQSTSVANDVERVSDGYLLAGNTSGGPDGGQDGFAVRVDVDGEVQWEKTFWNTPDTDDAVNAVTKRHGDGYVAAGDTSRFDDAWLVSIDEGGNISRNATIGGGSSAVFHDVVRHPDGGHIVVGSGDDNQPDMQGWVTRVDETFEQIWATGQFFRKSSDSSTNPHNDHNAFYSVSRDGGGFIMAGSTAFDPTGAEREGWILQINKNGTKQWDFRVGGDRFTELYDIQWDSSSLEYFAVGQTAANGDGVEQQGFVANFGLTGSTQWTSSYLGSEAETGQFTDVHRTGEGGIVCAGGAAPSTGANPDGWSVKIGGAQVATPTPTPTPTPTFTPTPSPTPTPTVSASPSSTDTTAGGGTTPTDSPTPTTTATPTDTPGGGTTTTAGESDSGLPLTAVGVGLAIVALAAGGFLYNRYAGGGEDGGDGDAPVAGPGAATGGAATLTGGDDDTDDTGDEDGGSEPTPATEVVGDEELERAQTVVDKPDAGEESAGDGADDAGDAEDGEGGGDDEAVDGDDDAAGDDGEAADEEDEPASEDGNTAGEDESSGEDGETTGDGDEAAASDDGSEDDGADDEADDGADEDGADDGADDDEADDDEQ